MIDRAHFLEGLHSLCVAFNREPSEDLVNVYFAMLGPRLTDELWSRAVKRTIEAEEFFPPVAKLLRYALADMAPPAALAGGAYDAILAQYERGNELTHREVRERFGAAAADAFVAAGGPRVFAWCEPRDQVFRRKRFMDCYTEEAEHSPSRALPAGELAGLLGEGDDGEAA